MKKITLFITLLFSATLIFGQADIQKKIEKSNNDIQNPKKSTKLKTWDNRVSVFLDAYATNLTGLRFGMDARRSDQNLFDNVETFLGQPEKIVAGENGMEEWHYPNIIIYVNKNKVDHWKEIKPVDANALEKAREALDKAIAIDKESGKNKYLKKSSTLDKIKRLRDYFNNRAVNEYFGGEYKAAGKSFEQALEVYENYPRKKDDTTFNPNMIRFYAAESALAGKDYDLAMKFYQKSIENNYELGKSYHGLYTCYIAKNDSTKAIEVITEGYEKAPDAEQILYDIINYYFSKNQPEKAESYLDLAIQKYPENHTLYLVKANLFVTKYSNDKDKYQQLRHEADSLRKAAFRNRMNKKENARLTKEMDQKLEEAKKVREDFMNNGDKAIENADHVIKLSPKNYQAYYIKAVVYYDRAEVARYEKGLIPYSEDKDGKKAAAKDVEIKDWLRKSAEQFEKASEFNPTDTDILRSLKAIYYRLQDNENYKRIKEKLENM